MKIVTESGSFLIPFGLIEEDTDFLKNVFLPLKIFG
jgi:hypothetical protein